jgi:hypothetical protein
MTSVSTADTLRFNAPPGGSGGGFARAQYLRTPDRGGVPFSGGLDVAGEFVDGGVPFLPLSLSTLLRETTMLLRRKGILERLRVRERTHMYILYLSDVAHNERLRVR